MEVAINHEPLVSIIIPLYNAQRYIKETIKSVLNQSYTNWELIIIDDCSTDNSIKVVNTFKNKKIKLIRSEINFGGPARPRNIGLDNANGDYIAFLDSDDVWLYDKLEKQVEHLFGTNSDIVYTLANTIDTNSNIIGKFNNQNIYNKIKYFCNDLTISYFSNYININTVLMKKDLKIKFREDRYLIAVEDWMFWIEHLYNNKKVVLLKESLINYRIDINSISDRSSDKSYRKVYILYSILFFEKKISFFKFSISFVLNSLKILFRHIVNIND